MQRCKEIDVMFRESVSMFQSEDYKNMQRFIMQQKEQVATQQQQ
tara:strand:- start:1356 stop:1487 length:132 start_codon:yes stop_codon:yes gene_type:complete